MKRIKSISRPHRKGTLIKRGSEIESGSNFSLIQWDGDKMTKLINNNSFYLEK